MWPQIEEVHLDLTISLMVILAQTRPKVIRYMHLLAKKMLVDLLAIENDMKKNTSRGKTGKTILVSATLEPFLPFPPLDIVLMLVTTDTRPHITPITAGM